MSQRILVAFLVFVLSAWASACSDSVDPSDRESGQRVIPQRPPLQPPSPHREVDIPSLEEISVEPEAQRSAPSEKVTNTLRRLDSALASDNQEQAMDLMLDLEDRGGPESVKGLGLVIDRALDDELKLDAIASLSMMAEDEDVSAPLLRAMDDGSPTVRVEALDAVADAGMVNLLPVLRVRLQRESEPETQEALQETIEELEYLKSVGSR